MLTLFTVGAVQYAECTKDLDEWMSGWQLLMAMRQFIRDLQRLTADLADEGSTEPDFLYAGEALEELRARGADALLGYHGFLLGEEIPWLKLSRSFLVESPRGGFATAAWEWLAARTGRWEVNALAAGAPVVGASRKAVFRISSAEPSLVECTCLEHRAMVRVDDFSRSNPRKRRGDGAPRPVPGGLQYSCRLCSQEAGKGRTTAMARRQQEGDRRSARRAGRFQAEAAGPSCVASGGLPSALSSPPPFSSVPPSVFSHSSGATHSP